MTENGPCTLGPEALEERARAWHSLDSALVGVDRTLTGALLRYRLDPTVAATLAELVDAEAHCCAAVSFNATVSVTIDGPEELREWVASTFVPVRSGVDHGKVREAVRAHYAGAARAQAADRGDPILDGIGAGVYAPEELDALPERVLASSIGCANPVAVARLAPGETVLDLGSGGGLDVLLSARRVGPTGKAYGLDMTDEMLQLAGANQAEAGIDNAEFLRGHIEAVPLPDASVDVVLSNCVISLSPDKAAVFAEAYRVLRPGGRLAVADVVADAAVATERDADLGRWVACAAGSLTRTQYRRVLVGAGFVGVSIDESHSVAEGFSSVVVRAAKPRRRESGAGAADDVPAALDPRLGAAGHRRRVVALGPEELHRLEAAPAALADDVDGLVGGDLVEVGDDVAQGNELGSGHVAVDVLLRLADVDHHRTGRGGVGEPVDVDLDVVHEAPFRR